HSPNVLRLVAAQPVRAGADTDGPLWLIQADIDDMAPEYAASAQTALLDAGALDAVLVPVGMKKGRQGTRLEVLTTEESLARIERLIFMATTTIGLRRWPVQRTVLERETEE